MVGLPERFRAEVAGLLDERFYPFAWVENEIAAGRIAILVNDTAIIGFEAKRYPGGASEIHGLFAAGDMPGVLALIDEVCSLGRELGVTVAAIESRAGWERLLKGKGFVRDKVRIVKELNDGL
jgi:hypothetical protein